MRQGSGRGLRRGVTLVELLVVMAIAMLVAGWSLSAFTEMRRNAEITAVSNGLLGILEAGRDLALARRARVVLCPSIDSQHCQQRWTDDLILFFDKDGNGRHDDGEEQLQVALTLPAHTFLALASFRRKPYMVWEANGQPYASNGTFTLCNEERQAHRLRQFVISRAGRVRLRQPEQQGASALQAAEAACNW